MKVYMETLGCPKNFNDSQVACGIMEDAGIQKVIDEMNRQVDEFVAQMQ